MKTRWARLEKLERVDRQQLDALAQDVHFHAGDLLVEQGQPLEELLLLVEGSVGVRQDYRGAHIDVTMLGPGEFVFRETFPFFMLSSLIDRIFTKPKGKAIDTLALEHIYRGRASGRGYLGRLIDRDFLNSPPCRTLKDRRKQIAGLLRKLHDEHLGKSDEFGVTSLMSGPGLEFYDFMDHTAVRGDVRATLFDTDVEALSLGDHLARERRIRHQLVLAQEDVRRLVTGKRETHLPLQDVVYSSSILDVLNDRDVVPLLDWVYEHLKPGGTCLLCNFGSANPDQAFMTHILDWHVTHRAVDDLVRLFSASRFGAHQLKVRVHAAGASLVATTIRTA